MGVQYIGEDDAVEEQYGALASRACNGSLTRSMDWDVEFKIDKGIRSSSALVYLRRPLVRHLGVFALHMLNQIHARHGDEAP